MRIEVKVPQLPESVAEAIIPKFSPDGKRLAFVAYDGDKEYVYLDGKGGPRYLAGSGRSRRLTSSVRTQPRAPEESSTRR